MVIYVSMAVPNLYFGAQLTWRIGDPVAGLLARSGFEVESGGALQE